MLKDKIVNNTLGITLKSFGKLSRVNLKGKSFIDQYHRKKSYIEDFENHFHVDDYFNPPDSKKSFMLGIKTLIALAEKFEKEKIKGVRFIYYFQTPELGKLWEIENGFLKYINDEHYINDRLSFFIRRKGEEVVNINNIENRFEANMVIDI